MPNRGKPKRKIMRSFKLDEVSAVDKPAQEGATMTLMKRRNDDALINKILHEYLSGKDFAAAAHARITKQLGEDVAKAGWDYFAALETSLHSIVGDTSLKDQDKVAMMKASTGEFLEVTKNQAPEVEAFLRESLSGDEGENMNLRQLQKQMRDLNGKLDKVLATQKQRTAKAQEDEDEDVDLIDKRRTRKAEGEDDATARLREMLGTEKAGEGYSMDPSTMSDVDTMKAEDEDEMPFEDDDMSYEEEETEKSDSDEIEPGKVTTEGEEEEPIAAGDTTPIGGTGKRASKRVFLEDDTIIVEGVRVHKARCDPGLFAVLKSQQDRVVRLEKQANEERAAREVVEFTKVAEEELGHLPGTPEQKAHLLRKLGRHLSPEERQLVSKMFRAGDRGLASAFNTVGTRYDGRTTSIEKAASNGSFTKRVNEIRARDNCSNQEAMRKARREFPDDFATMQGN